MSFQILNVIHILIIAQSFFFAFVLCIQRNDKRKSNLILATFLFLLGLQMTIYLLEDQGVNNRWLWGIRGVVFAYGPLMYFYTKSLTHKGFRLGLRENLHFIPALICIFLATFWPPLIERVAWTLYLSIGSYLFLSFRLIQRFRKIVFQSYSEEKQINLDWLQWSMGLFFLVLCADLISYILNFVLPISLVNEAVDFLVLAMVLLFVNTIVYKGLRYPSIFRGLEEERELISVKQGLILNAQHLTLLERLERLMQSEKPYLTPTLTIKDLATQLEVSIRILSEVINHHYKQNFSEYINAHRVELAKERLKNPKDPKETVSEIMYEVGFNSKSSFNTLFKKSTGLTPTEYKKKIQRTSGQ